MGQTNGIGLVPGRDPAHGPGPIQCCTLDPAADSLILHTKSSSKPALHTRLCWCTELCHLAPWDFPKVWNFSSKHVVTVSIGLALVATAVDPATTLPLPIIQTHEEFHRPNDIRPAGCKLSTSTLSYIFCIACFF